jgi:methionine sulfoxide reductase heme-binding subunit
VTWYVVRSAGVIAYLLLSTSVVVGVLMAARAAFTWPRFAVEELHRFLTIVTGVFLVLHGGALLLDRVVPISLGQMLVPFTTRYRPFAVGLGIVCAELLAAVGITNAVRRVIPRRIWRRAHVLTIPAWLLATGHGLLAGTDGGDPWLAAVAGAAISAVSLAFVPRVRALRQRPA